MTKWLKLIKINHWVKNLFIFAPLIFSINLFVQEQVIKTIICFISFSFITVFVYILNDIKDRDTDRNNYEKCIRPLASGAVSIKTALIIGTVFFTCGLGLSVIFLKVSVSSIMLLYTAINILYTYRLKNIPILDVFIIAIGFCLRVLMGAIAIGVSLSHWMLITTFTLSLILGFGKRRYELTSVIDKNREFKHTLSLYTKEFLDILIGISVGLTAMSYALYTMDQATIHKTGSDKLIYTSVFVIYGLYRYILIIYLEKKGGNPEEIFIKDPAIVTTILLWGGSIITLIYFKWLLGLINLDFSLFTFLN